VALNRFVSDSQEELDIVTQGCADEGADIAMCEVWEKGGEGGIAVAEALLQILQEGGAEFKPIYDVKLPITEKIETIARKVYGADGVDFAPAALRVATQCEGFGLGETPVCIAKTQYSFTDDQTKFGAPADFRITIRDIYPSAGAGFVVALAGDIMTMPGLGRTPAAVKMKVTKEGKFEGLF
jgi:formate--tetrahydrofolate ligase